jgi:hypothetical protein
MMKLDHGVGEWAIANQMRAAFLRSGLALPAEVSHTASISLL